MKPSTLDAVKYWVAIQAVSSAGDPTRPGHDFRAPDPDVTVRTPPSPPADVAWSTHALARPSHRDRRHDPRRWCRPAARCAALCVLGVRPAAARRRGAHRPALVAQGRHGRGLLLPDGGPVR